MTVHGREEMAADGLTVAEVRQIVLAGRIVERQRDSRTGEWKYLVEGDTVDGRTGTVVAKVGPMGRLVKRGTMNCDVCGKRGARVRRMTKTFGSGRSTFLIEGVPAVCCPHCGESYFTADTLEEIERIQKHRRKLGVDKRVLVANFKGAA